MILALLLACAQPPAPPPPAVVVIVTDTTRADLGGAEWPAWAAGGRQYTRAYSAAPYTTASTATLVTGRYPVGVERQPPTQHPSTCWSLARGEPTTYPWPTTAWPDLLLTDSPVVARQARVTPADYAGPSEAAIYRAAVGALESGHRAIYIHALGPHAPVAGLTEGWSRTTPDALVGLLASCGGVPDDLGAWYRWQHRAAVEHTLVGVEAVVLAAVATGATVIWTSDHGEALGEDGQWQHATALHDAQVRVPLVVWGPGIKGGTDDRPVPATCVGQTARKILGETGDLCDLRDGYIVGDVVAGMLLAEGVWDERIILSPQ